MKIAKATQTTNEELFHSIYYDKNNNEKNKNKNNNNSDDSKDNNNKNINAENEKMRKLNEIDQVNDRLQVEMLESKIKKIKNILKTEFYKGEKYLKLWHMWEAAHILYYLQYKFQKINEKPGNWDQLKKSMIEKDFTANNINIYCKHGRPDRFRTEMGIYNKKFGNKVHHFMNQLTSKYPFKIGKTGKR